MNAEKYHVSLLPLEEACRLSRTGWVCIPNPLVGWGQEGTLSWKLGILLRHFSLVLKIYKIRRQRILLREFSTLPLLMVFPLLWPLRKIIHFLIHHNLQWAVRSQSQRFGLMLLAKMGARWALFETQDFSVSDDPCSASKAAEPLSLRSGSNLGKFCIPSDKNLILPHPCAAVGSQSGRASLSERAVIGVAGYYRPEKGMDELLRLLVKHFPDCEIMAGVPNPEAVNIPSVKVLNTTSDDDYCQMLAQCDVLVQNGAPESYFYRASGVIADAATCGTAVVAPDFPMMGTQVAGIGEVFQGLDGMPDAVRRAVEKNLAGQYDFSAYCAARSAQALAERLDEFSRSLNG